MTALLDQGYIVGLDLGQADDYTALAVVQRLTESTARRGAHTAGDDPPGVSRALRGPAIGPVINDPWSVELQTVVLGQSGVARRHADAVARHYRLVHLERLRGVAYPDIVTKVAQLLRAPELTGEHPDPKLVVDATGVGRPVVDLFRKAGLAPVAVTITGGDSVGLSNGCVTVPKRDLVGTLLVLLQTQRLKIQRSIRHADTLQSELMNFKVKINATTAHDSYNAREGEHDDLVLAAALACWQGERPAPVHVPASRQYFSI